MEQDIKSFFQDSLKEEWYSLTLQKKIAIEKNISRLKRLYDWLINNLSGEVLVAKVLTVDIDPIFRNEVEISQLTIFPHLILKTGNNIWGILLCERFSRSYVYHTQNQEYSVFNSLELLTLIEGLKKEFPNANIKASLIQAVSKKDTANFLGDFEQTSGDNIISLLDSDVESREQIERAINAEHTKKCMFCPYYKLCFITQVPSSGVKNCYEQRSYDYTDKQKQVIQHVEGAIRVCAGPGSGKTATLVASMEYLIKKGVAADRILALTFTQKAAKEIADRINIDSKPVITTIHALAYQIVRQHKCIVGKNN